MRSDQQHAPPVEARRQLPSLIFTYSLACAPSPSPPVLQARLASFKAEAKQALTEMNAVGNEVRALTGKIKQISPDAAVRNLMSYQAAVTFVQVRAWLGARGQVTSCQPARRMAACLAACLPAANLPNYPHACLPACLPARLPACWPAAHHSQLSSHRIRLLPLPSFRPSPHPQAVGNRQAAPVAEGMVVMYDGLKSKMCRVLVQDMRAQVRWERRQRAPSNTSLAAVRWGPASPRHHARPARA